MLQTPHRFGSPVVLSPEDAHSFLTRNEVQDIDEHCAKHQVTTCPSCNALFRLDQLRHETIGYYPGPPGPRPTHIVDSPICDIPREYQTGNRYGYACPCCHTDLTDLVALHYAACKAATDANAKPMPPADC